jgi:hypothetical protein
MSMRYGRATFSNGDVAYIVYSDSPSGHAMSALFSSVDDAMEWRDQGFPKLDRTDHDSMLISKFSEEPVHILGDINFPDTPYLQFYTTASKSDMVITGPLSKEDTECMLVDTSLYTKEFFDAWRGKPESGSSIEKFETLKPGAKAFITSILEWWVDAQFLTKGYRGEYNVFDEDPDFVRMAKLIKSPEGVDTHFERCSVKEVARLSIEWWDSFYGIDGDKNIFDWAPDFISTAKKISRKDMSSDPEP